MESQTYDPNQVAEANTEPKINSMRESLKINLRGKRLQPPRAKIHQHHPYQETQENKTQGEPQNE